MPSDSRNDVFLRAGTQLGAQQSGARCREFSSAEQMNEDADEPPLCTFASSAQQKHARVQFSLAPKTANSSSPSTSAAAPSPQVFAKTPALFAVDAATTSEGSDHSDCEERHPRDRPSPLSPLVLGVVALSTCSPSAEATASITTATAANPTATTTTTTATSSSALLDDSPSPLPSPRSSPSDDLSSSDESTASSPSTQRSRARTDGSLGDVDDDDDDDHDDDEYDPSAPLKVLPKFGPSLSHINPKLEARVSRTGSGIFAVQRIEVGETLVVWTGRIITSEEALAIVDTPEGHYLLQIGDGFYQCPLQRVREAADFTNHSCNPNAGFGKNSPVLLSAIRPLEVGDEVVFDYGMCETDERLWHPMRCECGAPQCRKWITANDWKLYPELWTRYDGFWSPHVQARVDRLLGRPDVHAARQARAVHEQVHAVSTAPPLNVEAVSEVVASVSDAASDVVVAEVAEVAHAVVPAEKEESKTIVVEVSEDRGAPAAAAADKTVVIAGASAPTNMLTSWFDTALSWFGLVRASTLTQQSRAIA